MMVGPAPGRRATVLGASVLASLASGGLLLRCSSSDQAQARDE